MALISNAKGRGENETPSGYEIFYNFIRKHQSIGVCPYELATDIKLDNPNKWMGLIEMAKRQ